MRRMMRWIIGLVLGLASPSLSHATEAPISYVIGYSESHPFAAEIIAFLTEAYRRIGVAVVLRPYPPARSVEMANRGELDAEASRVPDAMDGMDGLIAVPEPIDHREAYIFTTGAEIPVDGWESLQDRHLCVLVGDLITMRRTSGMAREVSHDVGAQFRMLASGRCEAAISDEGAWLIIDQQHLGHFRMMEKPLQSFAVYHYVSRRHADLVPALGDAFRQLNREGFTHALQAPYIEKIAESEARNSVAR